MYLQQDILSSVSAFFNNAKDVKAAVQKAIDENADLKKQVEAAVRDAWDNSKVASSNLLKKLMVSKSLHNFSPWT